MHTVARVVRFTVGSVKRITPTRSLLAVAVVGGVALAGCGGSGGEGENAEPASTNHAVRIDLKHFGEPVGTVSLKLIDSDRTRVVVRLRRPTAWGRADIHAGSCLEHDPSVIVDLGTVFPGESLEVSVDVSFEALTSRQSSLAIHTALSEQQRDACADIGSSSPAAPLTLPRRAAQLAACYEPVDGWGLVQGACSRIEAVERVSNGVWRLQLRHPPVYCVEVHLNDYLDDGSAIIEGVGRLTEEPCPAAAYTDEPKPDAKEALRHYDISGKARSQGGSVSLTANGPDKTRVVVEGVDGPSPRAFIEPGRCRSRQYGFPRMSFPLGRVYSFRSVTLVPVPLRTLTATPHAFYVTVAGGHGRTEPPLEDCAEFGVN